MAFLSKLLKVIAFLPALITGIEPIYGSGTGKIKQDSVIGLVMTILGSVEAISAKDIADNDKFQSGLKKAIDGVVEMLNASIWYKR